MDKDELFKTFIKVKHALDFSEKALSQITVNLCLVFAAVVGYKTYVQNPISCYFSVSQSGTNFDEYVVNYCWARGTYMLSNYTPNNEENWKKHTLLVYYPWIPLILVIQGLLFAVPNLLWSEFLKSRYGNLNKFLKRVISIGQDETCKKDYNDKIDYVAEELEKTLYMSRDFRTSLLAKAKQKASKKCGLIFFSKRQGNTLVCSYFLIKIVSAVVCILQIASMKRILKLDNKFFDIYFQVFNHLMYGGDWPESPYFPRVTFCRVKDIRAPGITENQFNAQCILAINVLNEKIYIFLFLWITLLLISILYSTINFAVRIAFKFSKVNVIKKYLKMADIYKKYDKVLVGKFVTDFIRWDGYFILLMIRRNASERIACETTVRLWKVFKEKYRQCNFSRDNNNETKSMSIKLEPGDGISLKQGKYPTAPTNDYIL